MLRHSLDEKVSALIVGGGPCGLYLAQKLTEEHKLTQVFLADDRVDQYIRPGRLNAGVFEKVSHQIKEKIHYSEAQHIKDLERGLYTKVKKIPNLKIIHGKFLDTTLDGVATIFDKSTNQEIQLQCPWIFDATGPKRAVIHAFSKHETEKKSTFTSEDVADNPIKNHLLAYVKMEAKDYEKIHDNVGIEILPASLSYEQAIDMLNLQHEFGWKYSAKPDLHIYIANTLKGKVILYLEVPDLLPSQQSEAWLKRVIKLYTGEDIPFTKIKKSSPKDSQRWNIFHVQPQEVFPNAINTSKLCITPVGDAKMEVDYRLGFGITIGTERINLLLKYTTFKNGNIESVDFEKYNKALERPLIAQRTKIKSFYDTRKKTITSYDQATTKAIIDKFLSVTSAEERDRIMTDIAIMPVAKLAIMKEKLINAPHDKSKQSYLFLFKKSPEHKVNEKEQEDVSLKKLTHDASLG